MRQFVFRRAVADGQHRQFFYEPAHPVVERGWKHFLIPVFDVGVVFVDEPHVHAVAFRVGYRVFVRFLLLRDFFVQEGPEFFNAAASMSAKLWIQPVAFIL